MSWRLILHGGAKEIAPHEADAHRDGCRAALDLGRAVLERGGRAVEAVEVAVRALEADPTFNAGRGSVVNAEGEVEMDAALMDGETLDIGAVAGIKGVAHPVSVARLLLRRAPVLLVGDEARRFAAAQGAELCPSDWLKRPAAGGPSADTVGCVALDGRGDLATATSTGGLEGVMPGRVGDSPLPGCGYYADNGVGAVAFSGDGEGIARVLLAARVMQAMPASGPRGALDLALDHMRRVGGDAGGIAIDRAGRVGWRHNSPAFAVAYARAGEPARVHLHQSEDAQAA